MPEELTTRAFSIHPPQTLSEDSRSVKVTAATENPVPVFDWQYGLIPEIILMSGVMVPGGGQVPLLDAHDRSTAKAVLGSAQRFEVRGNELLCEVVFANVPDAAEAFRKIQEGHLRDFSIGYRWEPQDAELVQEGETRLVEGRKITGPARVLKRVFIKELSITPIGADERAKARSEQRQQGGVQEMPFQRVSQRSQQPQDGNAPQNSLAADEIRAEAIRAERTRAIEIRAHVPGFGVRSWAKD